MPDLKAYLLSLGAGLLVGVVYSLIGVRSPAPPTIALIGLLGILLGEQIVPVVKRLIGGHDVAGFVRTSCAAHVLGPLPGGEPAVSRASGAGKPASADEPS
ncbi:XapX domain-containing protein [Rhodoplanes elegans]|uniref:XapX domain-containing protein n=1 Tax=Rhodoplanes elegans TaxID=29408 RepID=A0A327KM08_9BRAD|nr:XapX domain-containing protein [Rhodoplanes elegans]RAI38563.1 XapX domain-containing protein [Rhodoplanes elegans]